MPLPTPPKSKRAEAIDDSGIDPDSERPLLHSRRSSGLSQTSRTSQRQGVPCRPSDNNCLNGLNSKSSSKQRSSVRFSRQHHDKGESTDESDEDETMTTNRPPSNRIGDRRSKSQVPLLRKDEERGRRLSSPVSADGNEVTRPSYMTRRRSALRSRTPEYDPQNATRRKYYIASFFLVVSLVSFVVQTETAVYIQHNLGWEKPYCMLYLTHGSWIFLWPMQLLLLRIQKRKLSWDAFWRRHVYLLRTTAQMVESRNLHLTTRDLHHSPIPYILRTTALITTALTVAGGSWYVAVNLTTASDLTAIYNCSAFFAYAFSIPLLNDKLRFDKVFSVVVAIIGVLVVAYGPSSPPPENGGDAAQDAKDASSRALGNIIIGVGSILYGLYEVLYKRMACPPEGTSTGRGVTFANTFASLIGAFTLFVLWIPLPVFHILGIETFELPRGQAASLLLISVIANATFSGSFLVLISLTSPVLSSVAALLTIFLVAIVDWKLTGIPLSSASIYGGILIIIAFLLLSWSTYRELDEDRRKRSADNRPDSESDV
ncbi:DUF6 domain-containing protein [Blastomyces gilchristii SLH14081]|uniref:DUF6 domain-containing protein n=1 Tax=Blastomyces gilchristii (strain SLH14081) TaxID=559298 RepID=A0A179UMZ9_BLAGS|nr:DUF6 domain-containing protein [Blastomyces gilchristii SLH14081]OAT07792.1 DUF6 domain-containing protein [Blastomyces gilchristii SLH14081]